MLWICLVISCGALDLVLLGLQRCRTHHDRTGECEVLAARLHGSIHGEGNHGVSIRQSRRDIGSVRKLP